MKKRAIKPYFEYLCDIVGKKYQYSKLLEALHSFEFRTYVPNDDNRAADGEMLREMYLDELEEQGFIVDFELEKHINLPKGPCTFLEMLIGLAKRLQWDLEGGRYSMTVSECYWHIIENLGLEWCDNVDFERDAKWHSIGEKVAQVVERRYFYDGTGGLFPLRKAKKDQRRVEIWYQMSAWVIENYPV